MPTRKYTASLTNGYFNVEYMCFPKAISYGFNAV